MPKRRKTKNIFVVQGDYGQGWEDVTAEDKSYEATERLREYSENEPEFRHRKIVRRVKINEVS